MLMDLLGGVTYVLIITVGSMYFISIALILGWNMLLNKINKRAKVWLLAFATVPALLFSLIIGFEILTLAITTSKPIILLYVLPVFFLLTAMGIQIKMYRKVRLHKYGNTNR